jgi:O6-methylguanine-DNA--protein-cysteine methyltransferase
METTESTSDSTGQEISTGQPETAPKDNGSLENQGKDTDYSQRFAELAKRDRVLNQQMRRLKEQESAIAQRENELKSKYSKFEELGETKDIRKVIEKLGYSFDDILEASLLGDDYKPEDKAPKQDPMVKALEDKIKQLEENMAKSKEEAKKNEETKLINQQKVYIQELIAKNSEKYPYANRLGKDAVEQAWSRIFDHIQETGEVLDYEEVVKEINDTAVEYLKTFSDIPDFGERLGVLKKIQSEQKAQSFDSDERAFNEADPWADLSQPKSLSNDMTSDDRLSQSFDSLDEDELLKKAAQMIRWDKQ